MNKTEVTEIKTVIKTVMEKYLFEEITDNLAKTITKDIAAKIEVKEFYDYTVNIEPNDGDLTVSVSIRDTAEDKFISFNAAITSCPAVFDDVKSSNHETPETTNAYTRAMQAVK